MTDLVKATANTGLGFDAIIIGAGFAGLYMTKRLLDQGLSVRTFEAGDGVGGTWYWNRYPGARVDLECFDYSYSFSPELEQDWEWTERYPSQAELLRYLNHVADRFDLREHIQLDTRIVSATYDEDRKLWSVTTAAGETVEGRLLISAAGVLSAPKPPELAGLDDFKGKMYHTGQWPHEGVDFTGQRVGVIGTGSSGVQSIPIIAGQAAHVTVFQRTPNYSVPSMNYKLTSEMRDEVRVTYSERREISRHSRFGNPAVMPTNSAMDDTPEERLKLYNNAWDNSHLLAFRMTYGDILNNQEANDTVAEFLGDKIRSIVKDPEIAEKLVPHSFPFGTKRPCLGTSYYETFNRDNVSLVDLRTTPIEYLTSDGVMTSAGELKIDSFVFATGFDAFTGALLRIDVRGRGGRKLRDQWAEGPGAYLGLATHGFPNLFQITGPGSPGPLANMAMGIEQHVEWISNCIGYMQEHGLTSIEAEQDAQDAWVAHVQEVVQGTLYLKAASWYVGANVPGKPHVFMPYLGGHGPYRAKCEEVSASGYRGFSLA